MVFPGLTMKTSKPRAQSSTQEQCGVWLDTVELKAKFKKDSSTSSTTVAPGTKRKHDMVDRISGVESQVKVARMDSPYKGPTTYEWTGQSVPDDMLFTQDSEGFRVIAHRGGPPPAPRTPLKDHTNLGLAREKGTLAQKNPLAYNEEEEEEEEEEMLFTQDSQGNVVIKH
ncbi:hypothetical protein CRUP_035951 [Coryphaenoides rupestris]|nr:hypothetical protein CRUP_035951 [Coryphaenoides rupestris]